MLEIIEEYGAAILGALGGITIAAFMGFAFMNHHGMISVLFDGLVALYL